MLGEADVPGERFGFARSVGLLLRQARLAKAIKEVLGIFGALEQCQLPLRAVDRVLRIDPQGLCVGLVELPELRQIGGQPDVTLPHVWDLRRKFAERRQRLRIVLQRIVGEPQLTQCPR
jgi:hypothetical protein